MSTYPSMMRHMIGKKDKAGRLLNTEQRMLTQPTNPYWDERADEETKVIAQFIGRDRYNEFINALPPQADDWTPQAWAMALTKAHAFVAIHYLDLNIADLIKHTLAPMLPDQRTI